MTARRGLRWCRSCRHWTRWRSVGRRSRSLVCGACVRRMAEGPSLFAPVPPGPPLRRAVPDFDVRERAAGAEAEARLGGIAGLDSFRGTPSETVSQSTSIAPENGPRLGRGEFFS